MTLEQVEDFVVAQIKRAGRGECNPWAICKDDQLIGTCFILSVDKELKSCDIGFALKESEWNNKIATTAANRMIEFIDHELGMHEVVADCEVEDLATARVLEKLGMKRVVVMENEVEREGSLRDLALYKLVLK
jgi:ribosomal-protein-alanine N-acetyltransferase